MIKVFSGFDEFEKAASKIKGIRDLRELLGIDINFLETYPNFTLINLKDALPESENEDLNNLLVLSGKQNLLYSARKFPKRDLGLYKGITGKKHGESTALCLVVLREVLVNYSLFFEKLREKSLLGSESPEYDELNKLVRNMRLLEDKLADFLRILLELEDKKVKFVDTELVGYDYDILTAKAKLLLDRSSRLLSQINSSKREIELHSTNALNKNVEFLSKMMMVLTLVGVVVTVPGSLGAFFGIPAISNITPVPTILFWVWIPTIAAAIISYFYWRKLDREQKEIRLSLHKKVFGVFSKIKSELSGMLGKR